MRIACLIACAWLAAAAAAAQETWQNALSRMPLGTGAAELDRTNCVPLLLNAFQSNGVVKALIFMPGATDEIYFFQRAHARLTNAHPTLLDAVAALTHRTFIQADFRPPFLLLHTTEDSLDVIAITENESTAARLRRFIVPGRLIFEDDDWDGVLAGLRHRLHIGLRPWRGSSASWHFYRHSFAACGLTDWEMLEALALAGKTRFVVHWRTADFEPDRREGPVPDPKRLSLP
ncbi:MAG: hypothetical protein KGJ60_13305 [Verrucomicrobiota bacterium]|nr:hypothetical protein [Verrucomicrobiota bacterium]